MHNTLHFWDRTRLRALRQKYGESPEQFAARVPGLTSRTIRYWESGEKIPHVGALERFCAALDIDIRSLFTKHPKPRAGSRIK